MGGRGRNGSLAPWMNEVRSGFSNWLVAGGLTDSTPGVGSNRCRFQLPLVRLVAEIAR